MVNQDGDKFENLTSKPIITQSQIRKEKTIEFSWKNDPGFTTIENESYQYIIRMNHIIQMNLWLLSNFKQNKDNARIILFREFQQHEHLMKN